MQNNRTMESVRRGCRILSTVVIFTVGAATAVTSADPPTDSEGYYHPGTDPAIDFAGGAVENVYSSLWGWWTPTAPWNLEVQTKDEGWISGVNTLGQAFELEVSSFCEVAGSPLAIWGGRISSAVGGSVIAWGFYLDGDSGGQLAADSIVPLYVAHDQEEASEIHELFMGLGLGAQCVLDDTGSFQAQQNAINAAACYDAQHNTFVGFQVACGVIGLGSCAFSFGAGCVGGFICVVGNMIARIVWEQNFAGELARANACLCLESEWRESHPGQPLPAPSCGAFECPPAIMLPIKLN